MLENRESLVGCGRLKVFVDCVYQVCRHVTPVDSLGFGAVTLGNAQPAERLVGDDVVQLMSGPGGFEYGSHPRAVTNGVSTEIENHVVPSREDRFRPRES
jgi:hypothetical protein